MTSQFENPTLRGTPLAEAGFCRWIELMSSRATVHGVISEFPEEEQPRAGEAGHPLDRRVPRLRGRRLVGLHRIRRLPRRPWSGRRSSSTHSALRRGCSARPSRPTAQTPSTARRGQVPAARGAEPGRHVHGVARSGGWAVDLHQPPAPGPPRVSRPRSRSAIAIGGGDTSIPTTAPLCRSRTGPPSPGARRSTRRTGCERRTERGPGCGTRFARSWATPARSSTGRASSSA